MQASISASRSARRAFGKGSREQNPGTWRADARSRCRLEEMEPRGARTCSDGYFTDGCVAARIADDRLDRPGAPRPSSPLVLRADDAIASAVNQHRSGTLAKTKQVTEIVG